MWVYVFGHELTHALWTWLFGGKVRLKASARSGHVLVSKMNFLIALAPYFFPLYVVAEVALFGVAHLFWAGPMLLAGFHLIVGAAYGFHATLTWHILESDQPDVTDQSYLFSAVAIVLGNAIVLLVSLPLQAEQMTVPTALAVWGCGVENAFRVLFQLFGVGMP